MDSEPDLKELYRLEKENNQMLRAMRRNARAHAFFKVLFYAVVAGVAAWFYLHFVAPLLLQMLDTLTKIQGASSQAHDQLSQWTDQLEKLKSFIPGASSTSVH